ncbi:MAG: type II/IV secretion system ATPase subunit [Candidatus Aenigmatarchaeota archaeon]
MIPIGVKEKLSDLKEKIKPERGLLRKKIKESRKSPEELEEKLGDFEVREPQHLLILPEVEDATKIDIQYPLLQPFAYANIKWSDQGKELVYRVVEPELSEEEEEIYGRITDSLIELVDVKLSTIQTEKKAMEYLEDKIKQIIKELDLHLKKSEFSKIMYYIYRNFIGLNKIEPLMHDPYIEDIGCDGTGTPVYVIHKKFGSMKTSLVYEEEDELKEFIVKLAERCGRYISYGEPLLDGSLPDGSRVQATYSEDVSTKGPNFSIRKFTEEPFSPVDMIDMGTASAKLMAYLWLCIENGTSMLICGGVASGKTSFLNAVSLFIPEQDKIVSIEDTRELNLPHENWIPSQIRSGFGMASEGESYGEVDMYDLLRASFRQNPDYVIVGEVRGEEAYVMFQGMSSGHPAMSTMHAGGVDTVIKRLQSPPIELPPSLVETLDMVVNMIHAKGVSESARRAKSIVEIRSVDRDTGEADQSEVFSWVPANDEFNYREEADYILTKIARDKGLDVEDVRKEIETRKRLLEWMYENGVKDWQDVAKVISEYLRNPEKTLEERDIDKEVYVNPPSSLKSGSFVVEETVEPGEPVEETEKKLGELEERKKEKEEEDEEPEEEEEGSDEDEKDYEFGDTGKTIEMDE